MPIKKMAMGNFSENCQHLKCHTQPLTKRRHVQLPKAFNMRQNAT